MIIPEDIRKCVAFLAIRAAEGEFKFVGSIFWIGQEQPLSPEGRAFADPIYAVTARHVIDAIRKLGTSEIYIRVNLRDGDSGWVRSDLGDWFVHPTDSTVDVAILKAGLDGQWDHVAIPYSLCVTDELTQKHEIGLGDEVFVTGLFRHHHGTRRNIPIIRVGNLSAMAEEKIQTRDFGLMEALLVEARSIGGLSGSPVFVNLGVTRMIDGQVKQSTGSLVFFLIGLIHGHFDIGSGNIDALEPDAVDVLSGQHVNTGMAIVTPIHRVHSVIQAFENR